MRRRVKKYLQRWAARVATLLLELMACTRGEARVNGAYKIRIHGRDWSVKAGIHQLNMLSAHADREEIITWRKAFNRNPNNTFLTHGEPDSALALKDTISERLHWPVTIPEYGQRETLK